MGSIPLVANIPQPEAPMPRTPLEAYARAVSLEHLQQQTSAIAQQTDQNAQSFPLEQQQRQLVNTGMGQENQARDIQLKDAQLMRQLAPQFTSQDENGKPAGYDFNGYFEALRKAGVSPQTIQAQEVQHANAVQQLTGASESVRKLQDAHGKRIYELAEGLKSIKDPEARQKAWLNILPQLGNEGVDIKQFPIQAPSDDDLTSIEASAGQHAQMLADAKDQSEISKNNRESTAAQLENKYLGIQSRMNQKLPVSADESAFVKAYERNKTLASTNTFNLNNTATRFSPTDPDVIAFAHGKAKMSDLLGPRASVMARRQLMQAAQQVNPNLATYNYDVQKRVEETTTSGPVSTQLTAINRAREHMGTFLDLAKALDNGNVQMLNQVKNRFKTAFGSDAPTDLNIAKQAFASEVGKAFAGSSVALADREELGHNISNASSWSQLAGAARTADTLLQGAQKALKRTHDLGMQGQGNFGQQVEDDTPTAPGAVNWSQYPEHRN